MNTQLKQKCIGAAIIVLALVVLPLDGRSQGTEGTKETEETEKAEGTKETEGEEVEKAERKAALSAHLVLKVIHPREVTEELIEESKKLGGFPMSITYTGLVIKVPREKLTEFVELATSKGWPLEKQVSREDLHRTIMDLQGRIHSKQEVLLKLREFFETSDASATIDIENKMTQLVQTIETLKGQLRVAEERSRYGVLTIDFRYRRRDNVVYTHSPFEWINTVDLDTFLSEF